ncbi:MAG: acyl-CoA thioesterase [Halobacteriaceae archaeon]
MKDSPYTYGTAITVRFRDLDPMGQVHNGVVLQYVEEARVRYFRDVLDEDITAMNGAIVQQDVEYATPIDYGSSVSVRYRVASVGETSLTMAFEVIADDAVAAHGEVVHVALDEDDAPTAVPNAWRERIEQFEKTVDGET